MPAELQDTLLAELSAHPERAAPLAAELEPLLDSAEIRIRAFQRLAEAEQHRGASFGVVGVLAQVVRAKSHRQPGLFGYDPLREVPYSRGIQGAIRDLLDASEPKIQQRLEERLKEYQQETLNRRDPFAVSRLARRLDQLKWGRELIVQERHRTGIGQTALEQQLALWAVAEAAEDPSLQALAFRRLAEDRMAELRFSDAGFAYRQLQDRFADVTFPDAQTVPQLLKALPADSPVRKELDPKAADRWPPSAPRITEQSRNVQLGTLRLCPSPAPGSLCAELDIWLDDPGDGCDFPARDNAGSGNWRCRTTSMPRLIREFLLSQGWGVGPLLILQVGIDLLGIAPLNDHGEPRPRVLWRVRMLTGH